MELQILKKDLRLAYSELNQVNQSFQKTLDQKAKTEARLKIAQNQLNQAQAEKTRIEAKLNLTQSRLSDIIQEKETLKQEIEQLQEIDSRKILED